MPYTISMPLAFLATLLASLLQPEKTALEEPAPVEPLYVTERVQYDSEDAAIWINQANPEESLILGTDKEADGALYVFNLRGEIIEDKVVRGLERPNNVDVAYGLELQGTKRDIAILTERFAHKIRVYSLPEMQPIDKGGIEVFAGEEPENEPMGIALYTSPADSSIYAIVSRKSGPTDGTYLWQYLLQDDGQGNVQGTLVRKFGNYSGKQEIEAVAVDNELGYVYYSDERVGVRKYYADPDSSSEELALFATSGFAGDQEGIALYKVSDSTGFILVSDQQANQLHVYPREGTSSNPHEHPLLREIPIAANATDGIDATSMPLPPDFLRGAVVAMSEEETYHLYRWQDIWGDDQPPQDTAFTAQEIIPFNATWKYLDNGSDQDTAWRQPTFADTGWSSGEGKFGYGIPDANTQVSYGKNKNKKYITTYFRKTFDLPEAAAIDSFQGQVKRDDGVIVYLNGQEVYRDNMPSGSVTYTTHASGTTGGDDGATAIPFSVPTTAFVSGSNTLAVEIHQANPSSSDIAFDLQLMGYTATTSIGDTLNGDSTLLGFGLTATPAAFDKLEAYPNPFSQNITVNFETKESTAYEIWLADSSGKRVGNLRRGTALKGEKQHITLEATGQMPGLYFVIVQTEQGSFAVRVLHAK